MGFTSRSAGAVGLALVVALLSSAPLLTAALADSGMTTASPSVAPPNTTISIINNATVSGPTPGGYYDQIFFIAVLTPSGTIYGCISDSSACNLEGFIATSPGTYQCSVPFGGTTESLSSSGTGGVSPLGTECSGSDAGTWTGMSSTLCGGVAPTGATCVGMSGFNDLVNGCGDSSYFIGFGSLTPSSGDTSQVGTYDVVTCWAFFTSTPATGTVAKGVASTASFQIESQEGVPQFPIGISALFAIALPVLLLARMKLRSPRQ